MTRRVHHLCLLTLLVLVVVSCGAKPTPTNTPVPTNTPMPTKPPATATPAPTNRPSVALGPEQRNEAGGFSYRLPADYETETEGVAVFALAPGAAPDYGPVILLAGGTDAFGMIGSAATLEEAFAQAREGISDTNVVVSEPRKATVGGVPALAADVSGKEDETDMAGCIVVAVPRPGQVFLAVAASPLEQWQSGFEGVFEAVLASIKLFPPVVPTQPPQPTSTIPPTAGPGGTTSLRQWASGAAASSEYGDSSWAAMQATGAPDVEECGDSPRAWASLGSDTVEWIELTYDVPVVPTEVNVVQSMNPSYVTQVELRDTAGTYHTVYTAQPQAVSECPYTLKIPVQADYQVVAVKITIDQTSLGDWNEIDAVELVGLGNAALVPTATAGPTAGERPAGFLWRIDRAIGAFEDQFGSLGNMDTDAAGNLYVSDNLHGVWVFDSDGNLLRLVESDEWSNPFDVKVAPGGKLYVADFGSQKVFIFSRDGTLLSSFGQAGTGDGEFGELSPDTLAISPDGSRIYVVDENQDASGNGYTRVQVFDAQGEYLKQFKIEEEFYGVSSMDCGPDGNLYFLGFVGGYVLKVSPDGTVLDRLGKDDDTLWDATPYHLALDNAGNIYVATWDSGVLKLDSQGKRIGQFGFVVEYDQPVPEGAFASPYGIAVLPDGSRIFVNDSSSAGEGRGFITAFRFP